MKVRWLRIPLLVVPGIILGACAPAEMTEEEILAHAHEIHAGLLTIDTHVDISGNFATAESDPGMRGTQKVDLPKMREGGLDAVFFAVYVGQTQRTPENYVLVKADAMNKFTAIHRMAEDMYPDQIEIPYSADDIERIAASGKLVACIGIENGYAIGQDISLLETYYDLGARYVTLTHNGHNDIADSCNPRDELGDDEEEFGGLSDFGREVVAEMNRLGIIIDVAHASRKTMMEAVSLSQAPIIASHSGARALADNSRNLDDEQLLALKDNGGVIHVVALDGFLKVSPEKDEAMTVLREEMGLTTYGAFRNLTDEQRAEYERRVAELDERWPRADIHTYADHIDYLVNLIGIDHVGIGTDFDGGGGVAGFNDASDAPNVTAELVRRGYSDDDIAKIWSGNFLRVLRENESVAGQIQGQAH
jgi:membrane dipeptidase